MGRELSSKRMKLAYRLMDEEGYSRSMALRLAHAAVQLHCLLRKGTVTFHYFKENGEQRQAFGTLCAESSEGYASALAAMKERHAEADGKAEADKLVTGVITYWDLQKRGFRSFKARNLIGISSVIIPIRKFFCEP